MKSILVLLILSLTLACGEVVSLWSFENNLNDSAPAGSMTDNLEPTGEPDYADGMVGRAVRITADGLQRLRADDSDDLDLAESWTLEVYVWPDADNAGEWDRFWTKWGDGGEQWHTAFRSTGAVTVENGLDLFINAGNNIINSNNTAEVTLEKWSHIAFIGDAAGGTFSAWLNGVQVGEAPYETVEPGDGAMNFGNFQSPANGLQYSGLIDDAAIHNVAVTEAYLLRRAALLIGGDPDGDNDGDGLTNAQENGLGTDPNNADTDGDTLADGVESNTGIWQGLEDTGTNPKRSDTDADGFSDSVENPDLTFVDAAQPGTDPNKADTDEDGFSDGLEILNGADPKDPNDQPVTAVVSRWSFEGNLEDSAASGLIADTLEPTGDVAYAPGLIGQAANLTADGLQRLRSPDSNDLDLAASWTLEVFVWPDAENAGEWDRFWTKWGDGGQQWHLAFRSTGAVDVENGIDFFINGSNNIINSNDTAEVPLEEWSHVAVVGDPAEGAITAWLNGEQVGTTDYLDVVPGAGAMNFGNFESPANGLQYSGLIDEAQIHAAAVSVDYLKERAALTMPDPGIRLEREQVDFGAIPARSGLQQRALAVTNPGASQELQITSVSLTNNPTGRFSVVSSPTSIGPQSNGDIVVGFDDGGASGTFTTELVIESNAQGQPARSVPVSARVVPSNQLLVHFKMDELEGDTLVDASGNGHHGVYQANAGGTFSLGQAGVAGGTSVAFSDGGTNEGAGYGEILAESGLPPLQTFTLSMWIQIDANDFQTSSLFSKGFVQGDPFGAVAAFGGETDPIQWFEGGVGALVANVDLMPGRAQHLVVTHLDGNEAVRTRIYLDGELVAEDDEPGGYDDFTPSPLQLGATLGAFGFTGLFDDVQIYEKELSGTEVQFLFSNPGEPLPGGESPQPGIDTDRDGSSDEEEIHAGTDPEDPSDYLHNTSIERTENNSVVIRWTRKAGKDYDIEYAETLKGPWSRVATQTGELVEFEDTDPLRTTKEQAYYRIRVQDDL